MNQKDFSESIASLAGRVSPVEARVIDFLARHRETALHASAAKIAAASGTSDATVIRTARKLGYADLDSLRRALADDLRRELTLSERMANELARAGGESVLSVAAGTLRASLDAIEALAADDVQRVTDALSGARRIHVFGIGPSGFIAGYFATQLVRLGFDARAISRTGLQFADDLVGILAGDAVIALAYDRPYPEVRALFDRVVALGLVSALVTSTGPRIPDTRAGLTLRVPRGSAGGFGLHAGTLALLEGLLITLSAAEPEKTRSALEELNTARQAVSGDGMDL